MGTLPFPLRYRNLVVDVQLGHRAVQLQFFGQVRGLRTHDRKRSSSSQTNESGER